MSHDEYVMLLSTALISEFETFSHHELNLSEEDETATVSNDPLFSPPLIFLFL